MKVLRLVVTVMSLAIAGLGVLGMTAPAVLLETVRSLLNPPALYWVAALRVVFGALLMLVAATSRAPGILRVIGVVIVIVGLLTPWLGSSQRLAQALTWLSGQGLLFVRIAGTFVFVVGLLFVYAINPRRRGAV